jgi:cytochrome c-type biogenesis protein CcmH/NrfG
VITLVGNIALARSGEAAAASDWSGSARWARLARRLSPWAAEPWRRLGEAQRAEGDAGAARRSLLRAVGRDPSDGDLWVALARVSAGAERRNALERAARLNPRGAPPVDG